MSTTTTSNDYRIVSPEKTVEAMRDSGYKSTDYALAELIDNSIDAGAELVEVFCVEEPVLVAERTWHRVTEIAVLDDGHGMDKETLRRALKFGDGTRQERKSIGRFGMGLPNSSMSQCERVDVWTWHHGPGNALRTYLDLDEVRAGAEDVPEPVHDSLPDRWRDLSEGVRPAGPGTLVVWSRLDRVQWRGAAATLKHTEELIGRIYRHFLAGGQRRIRLVRVREGHAIDPFDARSNDPLYLLHPSSTDRPFHDQPMFEPYGSPDSPEPGVHRISIRVGDQEHEVTIRAAVARLVARRPDLDDSPWPEKYRNWDPGDTPWGKHAGRNIGVSLVRSGRELDLDDSWAIGYDPVERWWGVEIDFPPALDEVFGVTNTKQAATIFRRVSHFDWRREAEPGESFTDLKARLREENDQRLPLIDLAYYLREQLLRDMRRHLTRQTEGTRARRKRHEDAEAHADDAIRRRVEEGHLGETDKLGETTPPEERREGQVENLTKVHHLPKEDAERHVDETLRLHRRARMVTSHQLQNPAFFDVEFFPEVLQVALNMDHPAYRHLVEVLDADDVDGLDRDQLADRLARAATAFKVMLYAWARYEDEGSEQERKRARKMRWDWGMYATEFLETEVEE